MRLYEMFMGPLEAVKPWQTEQISGVVRFQNRVHALAGRAETDAPMGEETERLMHQTIKKVHASSAPPVCGLPSLAGGGFLGWGRASVCKDGPCISSQSKASSSDVLTGFLPTRHAVRSPRTSMPSPSTRLSHSLWSFRTT
eukprot:scaffold159670_cov32-Tisochrysis_lutea.AAC.6